MTLFFSERVEKFIQNLCCYLNNFHLVSIIRHCGWIIMYIRYNRRNLFLNIAQRHGIITSVILMTRVVHDILPMRLSLPFLRALLTCWAFILAVLLNIRAELLRSVRDNSRRVSANRKNKIKCHVTRHYPNELSFRNAH